MGTPRERQTKLKWQVQGLSADEPSTQRSEAFQVGPLSCRVRIETFARGGNEVSIYLDVDVAMSPTDRAAAAGELRFSLSVQNHKDELLSICMDAAEPVTLSHDSASCISRGFDHFMTSHLLLDEQAGYLEKGIVLLEATASFDLKAHTSSPAPSPLSPRDDVPHLAILLCPLTAIDTFLPAARLFATDARADSLVAELRHLVHSENQRIAFWDHDSSFDGPRASPFPALEESSSPHTIEEMLRRQLQDRAALQATACLALRLRPLTLYFERVVATAPGSTVVVAVQWFSLRSERERTLRLLPIAIQSFSSRTLYLVALLNLPAEATVGDLLRKLRQMAPVRGSGDISLLLTWRHRIRAVLDDPRVPLCAALPCALEDEQRHGAMRDAWEDDQEGWVARGMELRAEEVPEWGAGGKRIEAAHIAPASGNDEATEGGMWSAGVRNIDEPMLLMVAEAETVAELTQRIVARMRGLDRGGSTRGGGTVPISLALVRFGGALVVHPLPENVPVLQISGFERPGEYIGIVCEGTRIRDVRGSPGDRVRTLQAVWANGFPQSAGTSEVSDAASGEQGGDGEVEEAGDAQATLARLAQELERLSDDFYVARGRNGSARRWDSDGSRASLMGREDPPVGELDENWPASASDSSGARLPSVAMHTATGGHSEQAGAEGGLSPSLKRPDDCSGVAGLRAALAAVLEAGVREESLDTLEALSLDLGTVSAIVQDEVAARRREQAVPDSFRCPITQEVMVDPVMVAETGHTYERAAILRWLGTNSTDPRTNVRLTTKLLVPNHGLRATIEDFLRPCSHS